MSGAPAEETPPMTEEKSNDDWRACFIDYYTTNAPSKVVMVTDALMDKWEGKYEKLFTGMKSKYGEPGHPIVPPPAAPKRGKGAGGKGGKKMSLAEAHDTFVETVAQKVASLTIGSSNRPQTSLVHAKQSSAANGLETATFTVCARIRPVSEAEASLGGEHFCCVVPGAQAEAETLHSETAMLFTPKLSFRGVPELVPSTFTLDYVFSDEAEDYIYETVARPLVAQALVGRTSVIFAYGQTGSGKTHTMNHIMDRVALQLFEGGSAQPVVFSYMEVMGKSLSDPLAADGAPAEGVDEVKLGEVDGGAIEIHNLSEHAVSSAGGLSELISKAKAKRCVAATEMNDASSRSHGVAVFNIGHSGALAAGEHRPADGKLIVIDLAGSESAKDVRKHDKVRMDETKQINISLNALKECIQARTLASSPGAAHNTHVPFRRSKLTLLLKDIFDVSCPRLTSTVVIATVNPMAPDAGQTNTTLGYAAPLREAVGMFGRTKKPTTKKTAQAEHPDEIVLEVDASDPALWSEGQVTEWLQQDANLADAAAPLTGLTGLQLCSLPEPELYSKIGDSELASSVHAALWALILAAKLIKRRPDGRILSDEEEAAEAAAQIAADTARMDAQSARAAAAAAADREAREAAEAAAL